MTSVVAAHLSADELDSIHEARPAARAMSHLETCPTCRAMVRHDAQLIAALAALPTWQPSAEFPATVLSRLAANRAAARVAPTVQPGDRVVAARRRMVVGGALAGSLVAAGFVWAILDPAAAQRLAGPALDDLSTQLWLTLQALVANTTEQPWFAAKAA